MDAEKRAPDTLTIIGSSKHPWRASEWRAVDDRVRGGSSRSHLAVLDHSTARFYGKLDTTTLGGAGFASQTSERRLKLPRSHFSGLRVHVHGSDRSIAPSQPTSFTLNLKTVKPERRPDGRLESRLTYEFEFDGSKAKVFEASWDDFKATYRGRPASDAPALDPNEIVELTIMCRSNFNKQSGDFDLLLGEIEAVRTGDTSADAAAFGPIKTQSLLAWLKEALLSFLSLFSRRQGAKL